MHIFLDDEDRAKYLKRLLDCSCRYSVEICAWCLMPNHVHLIVREKEAFSYSLMMKDLSGWYARYFNWKYHHKGHVWEKRFYGALLDERHYRFALAYVERNPVRGNLVQIAYDYAWSSARSHCGLSDADSVYVLPLNTGHTPETWRAILKIKEHPQILERIRTKTRKRDMIIETPLDIESGYTKLLMGDAEIAA